MGWIESNPHAVISTINANSSNTKKGKAKKETGDDTEAGAEDIPKKETVLLDQLFWDTWKERRYDFPDPSDN